MPVPEKTNLSYDLIVIGGGITGIGVALEAGLAGLKTLLLESKTLGSRTSSNSLRIIHGGFRYLKTLDFPRVMSSLEAQSEILRDYSDFVEPLPCLMPLASRGLRSRRPTRAAALLYSLLARMKDSPLPKGRILSREEVKNVIPCFRESDIYKNGALLWYDALIRDQQGLMERLLLNLKDAGVEIAEQVTVKKVERDGSKFKVETEPGRSNYSRAVVNATGPWLEELTLENISTSRQPLSWCRAFNLVVSGNFNLRHAVAFDSGERFFFMVPRGENSAIGTWYVEAANRSATHDIEKQHILDFIDAFNRSTKGAVEIKEDDICEVEWGTLPSRGQGSSGPIQYTTSVMYSDEGYLEVLATKLTTFRVQGRKAIQKLGLRA